MSDQVKVPDGWKKRKIKDVISEIISGQSPNRKEHPARSGEYGILKTTAIDWHRYYFNQNQEILDDFIPNTKHEVKKGDILITKAGPDHRVGVVCFVKETKPKILVSGKMTLLRVNDKFDAGFTSYALSIPYSQEYLKGNTTGMASSQTNFTHDSLVKTPILTPPLSEQKKIASILTSVDDVIEKTETQIRKLQDLKKGMMTELLTKGIGHTEFKDSPVGRIPKSWEVKRLGDVATLQRGHDLTKNQTQTGIYPVVSSSGVTGYHSEFKTSAPAVLVGRKGSIGTVHYFTTHVWAHDTSLYVIDFHGNIEKFIYYQFLHLDLGQFGTKSGSPSLNRNDIHPIKVALPKPEEQYEISDILDRNDMLIKYKKEKLSQIKAFKKALMNDLLTGKKRVNIITN